MQDIKLLNNKLLLQAIERIETRTGKMFHESHPELDELANEALDGIKPYGYVIERLNQCFDTLNQ